MVETGPSPSEPAAPAGAAADGNEGGSLSLSSSASSLSAAAGAGAAGGGAAAAGLADQPPRFLNAATAAGGAEAESLLSLAALSSSSSDAAAGGGGGAGAASGFFAPTFRNIIVAARRALARGGRSGCSQRGLESQTVLALHCGARQSTCAQWFMACNGGRALGVVVVSVACDPPLVLLLLAPLAADATGAAAVELHPLSDCRSLQPPRDVAQLCSPPQNTRPLPGRTRRHSRPATRTAQASPRSGGARARRTPCSPHHQP